ncbi:redoxin domain-containing protein [Pedobacter sp. L105]|uniref:redoxin domain-containing protein n=1 Tax=Pedobacter sp. L105 TaxID=1641871 RepID=UPI00131B4737|nr:redoxin domain-containing protein [Pedobacter sp. L105]
MKIHSYCFIVLFLILGSNVNAQINIVNDLVGKIDSYYKLDYKQICKQKSPFSDDFSSIYIKSSVAKSPVKKDGFELFVMDEARGFKYISNGSIRMDLNEKDKTYKIKNNSEDEPYQSPYYWADFMKKQLKFSTKKLISLPDTIINTVNCLHIEFLLKDSVNSRLSYDICLNKKTGLPVYTKQFIKGSVSKVDFTISEILTMINENNYSNYNINPTIFPKIADFKIPVDYSIEKKISPLKPGDKIPEWKLQDLCGKTVSNKDLEGSLVLIDFSYNECAGCALSIFQYRL